MTMQTYVFYEKHKQPTLEELQVEIIAYGFDYQLPDSFNIEKPTASFVNGEFESVQSGFDYLQNAYNEQDWQWSKSDSLRLNSPEVLSVFNTNTNTQQILAMLIVSSVLTKLTGGVMLSDFFDHKLIDSQHSINTVKQLLNNAAFNLQQARQLRTYQ